MHDFLCSRYNSCPRYIKEFSRIFVDIMGDPCDIFNSYSLWIVSIYLCDDLCV